MSAGLTKQRSASKPAPARPAEAADQAPSPDRPSGAVRLLVGLAAFLHWSASWLVSALVHMILLMILALWLLPPEKSAEKHLVTAAVQDSIEELENFDELEELEPLEEENLAFTIEDPGIAQLGELDLGAPGEDVELSRLDFSADLDQLGTPLGELDGTGRGTRGDGLGAEFFGVRAQGQRFVFVVDNSLSMNGGRFEGACIELLRSVDKMTPYQQFYVFFFSDTAYPMFHPEPVNHMLPASAENKQRLAQWLYSVQLVLKTNAQGAMEQALKMHPDAIYVLTDGAFTDRTTPFLLKLNPGRTAIHTVGLEVKPGAANDLKAIAERHHGTFRLVAVDPRLRAMAKQKSRPTNRTRGAVWGIALPPAGQQKGAPGGARKRGGQGPRANRPAGARPRAAR